MKTFVPSCGSEYIVEARLYPKERVVNDIRDLAWVDQQKSIVEVYPAVDNVSFYVQTHGDQYGNAGYSKIFIAKQAILELAEKIKEIESKTIEPMNINDIYNDLPF